jgi:hypothetical protein
MRPGAEIDDRRYSHRRTLAIAPSAEGLTRLRLVPEETAVAREDLADVRIVDDADRQWPYVLEPDRARAVLDVGVGEPLQRAKTSRYPLELPASAVSIEELSLETDTAFVDRAFRLVTKVGTGLDGTERTLAAGRLVRRSDDHGPLTIVGGPWRRVRSLDLVIENGDEMPLVFRGARARAVLPEVALAAPAGTYRLLVGNPDDTAPSYELARVRDVVLAMDATTVPPGRLEANPSYSVRARYESSAGRDTALLWTILIVAVLALGGFTLRLARAEGGTPR